MENKNFDIQIICNKCGSNNVHICKHLDFTGWEDNQYDTSNIVLVCQNPNCENKEIIYLKYEILF
jgi:hypothetical protein